MRIGIMQPYFFPYIGYFQLVNAVDVFVVLDDVAFIKKGWINRNRILINGRENNIGIPCMKASQNKLINETCLDFDENSKNKLLKTIYHAYHRALFFEEAYGLIERVIHEDYRTIGEIALRSMEAVCDFLSIGTSIVRTASVFDNRHLKREDRLIDICRKAGANEYFNAIGGVGLYSKGCFREKGVSLNFIQSSPIEYRQFGGIFVPWLSIIDVLMFNPKDKIQGFLKDFVVL